MVAAPLQTLRRDWVEVPTLGDLVVRRAALWPETDAVVFPERRETGAELLASSVATARSLLGLGLVRGETVAILMPNELGYLHVLYGCAMIGVRALLVNARYKAYELAYVLEHADVSAVVTSDTVSEYVDFVPLLEEATARRPALLRHLVLLGSSSPAGFVDREAFTAAGAGVEPARVHGLRAAIGVRDVGILMYTSGTRAAQGLLDHARGAGADGDQRRGPVRAHRRRALRDPLPFFHMGAMLQLTATLHAGGTFLTMTHFEPDVVGTAARSRAVDLGAPRQAFEDVFDKCALVQRSEHDSNITEQADEERELLEQRVGSERIAAACCSEPE